MAQSREYITAIAINKGIITLIEPNGNIAEYRQRGIGSIEPHMRDLLIRNGMLTQFWNNYKELPKLWSISFEDEEIMGKARAGFPLTYMKKR